jgi:hypothetical protein
MKWVWMLLTVKVYLARLLFMMALLGLGMVLISGAMEEGATLATRALSLAGGPLVFGLWGYILKMALPPLKLSFRRRG